MTAIELPRTAFDDLITTIVILNRLIKTDLLSNAENTQMLYAQKCLASAKEAMKQHYQSRYNESNGE